MEDLCDKILLKISEIKTIPCCEKIYSSLDNYTKSIIIIKSDYCDDSNIFDFIKETFIKNKMRHIHYGDYRNLPNNYLNLLSIILNLLNLIYKYINLFNSKNIHYDEQYKIEWFELIKRKYDQFCNDFYNKLPCIEGLTESIESNIKFLEIEPIKLEKNNTSIIMKRTDFNNDGDFIRHYKESLKDYEAIGLSIKSFRLSLCDQTNDCNKDDDSLRNAYNIDNYSVFLDYINFETITRITKDYAIEFINDNIGGIDIVSIEKNKFCCKKELNEKKYLKYKNKYLKYKNKYLKYSPLGIYVP